ncbi:MAG: phospholipase effector Tle1 domain-containing protein, partial [Vicinamibacterales bacterium]
DTVDAYGLPVDELTDGVDRWVWPLSMPDLTLHPKVKRACHVLALDDERNTFHPVLWDESTESRASLTAEHVGDERISQVWFSGMHSNVGGGYPDDALSYVSLKWMTDQASDRSRGMQLIFVPELLQHHTRKADPFGRVYDSRQGLKGYYRYNPRRIEWLTDGQTHEHGLASPTVTIPRPKIHESVFRRIAAAPEAYAPIVFPRRYAVVMEDGRILEGDANPYESAAAAEQRSQAQEAAWDLVWRRRVVYFATVAASLYLLVQPLRAPVPAGTAIEPGLVARLLATVGSFTPAVVDPWIRYYQAHPTAFVLGLAILLLLKRTGRSLQSRICGTMRGIWLKVVPPARGEWHTLETARTRLMRIRSHRAYQTAFAILRRKLLPNVFGIVILAWLIGAANRAPFEILQATGLWGCKGGGTPAAVSTTGQSSQFASSAFCTPTGIQLERGARYRLTLGLPANWRDGGVPVPSPAGITSRSPGLSVLQRAVFTAFVPFRRRWDADWFVPVARIGERGIDHYPLTQTTTEITAQSTG